MNNYKITVTNGGNVIIYEKIISAENENKALIKLLQTDVIICSDDSIKIEEN